MTEISVDLDQFEQNVAETGLNRSGLCVHLRFDATDLIPLSVNIYRWDVFIRRNNNDTRYSFLHY